MEETTNECLIPVPRPTEDTRWYDQHIKHIHECHIVEPDVLLIGASIIQNMVRYKNFWDEFCSLHPLNLGIGGDRTQHTLWRVMNGSIDQTDPKAIVLHCGGNNSGNSPQQIAEGILKIVDELRKICPAAHIIVWGLLPYGRHPNEIDDRNTKVNEILKNSVEDRPQLEIICSGDVLRQSDGLVSITDMYDFLHPTEQGYLKSFKPVLQRLKEILNSHAP